jgi:hypothetical protein
MGFLLLIQEYLSHWFDLISGNDYLIHQKACSMPIKIVWVQSGAGCFLFPKKMG